jgi:hypothetical protein
MKNSIRIVLGTLVLGVAAYTNSANATLISSGTDADGTLLIYDNVNNITWYDSVFIAPGTTLNVTKTLANTMGWALPTIGQLTTLQGELGSNPANWGPFVNLPQYSTDSFVSSTLYPTTTRLERENLVTAYVSTGTSSGMYGDGLYEHAGQVADAGQVSVPDGGATALLLGMGLGGLHWLRRRS